MRTLGVDFAAQPRNTAACLIGWHGDHAIVQELVAPVDDERFRALADQADKVGLDVPFGWPASFVSALRSHAELDPWPATDPLALRFRRTDLFVQERTRRWPLGVSTDRIGITAFRAARLLSSEDVDRSGAGKFVEVYPQASRERFATGLSVEELVVRAPWLRLSAEQSNMCHESNHCFDAVLAALTARASALRLCEAIPEKDVELASREGWIALPREGSLDRLIN